MADQAAEHYRAAQRLQADIRAALERLERSDPTQEEDEREEIEQKGQGAGGLHHRAGQQQQQGNLRFNQDPETYARGLLRDLEGQEQSLQKCIDEQGENTMPAASVAVWRARNAQVASERNGLARQLARISSVRAQALGERRARAQLLGGNSAAGEGGLGGMSGDKDHTQILIGDGESLSRSAAAAAEIFAQGTQIAGQIAEQNALLLGIREKMLDMAGTLGVSTALMRVIQRRQTVDRIILWGGMGLVTLLVIVLYIWTRYG
jgi:golgi SNAP receptor complex member 2